MILLIPFTVLSLVGCQHSSGNTEDPGAVQHFLLDAKTPVTDLNKEFSAQANLVEQMSLKKIPFTTFHQEYDKNQKQLNADMTKITSIQIETGAKTFRDRYVGLLTKGVQLMGDEGNAMKADGTMDAKQAATIQSELKTFSQQFQDLQKQYHVK